MSDPKSTVRYIGYRSLNGGGRGFEFSCGLGAAKPTLITIEASSTLFQGPDRIAIQEAAGICYETLKCRIHSDPTDTSERFDLTSADINPKSLVMALQDLVWLLIVVLICATTVAVSSLASRPGFSLLRQVAARNL
jgi:hypothetical protein